MGSCGWQEAEMVVPRLWCQDSVSQSNSSSAQAGHSLFTIIITSHLRSTENSEAEVLRPGLDCTGCSDKTTGKGRLGQGTWEAGWGYCYSRKSSIIPQITCHTCGVQDLIQSHAATSQELGTGHQGLRLDST